MNESLLFTHQPTIRHKTKKEIVANQIIERIITGLLSDQDVLPGERELSKLFEVSRETLRGALTIVEDYGLITIVQGSKTRVNANEESLKNFSRLYPESMGFDVNTIDIDTVFETRILIESAAIRKTVKNITNEQVSRLEKLVISQEKLYEDQVAFHLSDRYFHKLLAQYSGNGLLQKYSKQLYNYALVVRRQVMSNPMSIKRSVKEHQRIVEQLNQRNIEGTVNMLTQHLASVHQTTKDAFTALSSND